MKKNYNTFAYTRLANYESNQKHIFLSKVIFIGSYDSHTVYNHSNIEISHVYPIKCTRCNTSCARSALFQFAETLYFELLQSELRGNRSIQINNHATQ